MLCFFNGGGIGNENTFITNNTELLQGQHFIQTCNLQIGNLIKQKVSGILQTFIPDISLTL